MDWHTIGHSNKAAIRQAEMFRTLFTEIFYFSKRRYFVLAFFDFYGCAGIVCCRKTLYWQHLK